jgi:ABC-type nickel/cobalt efflux system permease component RcnA
VGWRAIVARPGRGTAVRSSAPSGDPTEGLRRYPEDLLESPADVRAATFTVAPGTGTLDAPDAREGRAADREDPLTAAFTAAAAGETTLVLLLLAAFAWGALHALSPGHGKAMVAAYLVGVRGTARHAVALGATVTIAHTAGVFALGGVAVGLSAYVLPEDLYPWLSLVSGLLVLGVGTAVLRGRLRHRHHHDHGHHHHDHPERLSWRSLIALGGSAGLIPCPSALVVLLAALTQGQVALGMLLIVAFSAGLAAMLTALGLAVVLAARTIGRARLPGRAVAALPTASAVLIVGVGVVLTVQALPQVA